MSEERIRRCGPEDFPRLLDIWYQATCQGHPFLSPEQIAQQYALVRDHYMPVAELWAAETEDGVIVGFIALLDSLIGGLFVDPVFHRCGIGTRLIQHARSLRGTLSLGVYAQNEDARRLYGRLGFREVGRSPQDDAGLPFEVIAMDLDLTAP
ncbi:GNAT family N-acetyltransferase [Novispirillum itersonii]|uniref:Putative acetyltransferase n=1 Tax=Novispirillum itersonii TaxID=189 RepID=A0A7X0DP48_NOVIT|nr:GNAT family N-acetyltransferase [Novispirillum itersonii]MBB6210872.1 putative acetyltransferase [Novispirillum itersonii]